MVTKNIKLEQEIISLHKEVDQYKRTLTNIRNTILKLNENFSQNKGKSCQLLNENEWMQCSYFSELKVNVNTKYYTIVLYILVYIKKFNVLFSSLLNRYDV